MLPVALPDCDHGCFVRIIGGIARPRSSHECLEGEEEGARASNTTCSVHSIVILILVVIDAIFGINAVRILVNSVRGRLLIFLLLSFRSSSL